MCPGSDDIMKVSGDESQHLSELTEGFFKRFEMNVDEMLMSEMGQFNVHHSPTGFHNVRLATDG